MTLDIGLSLHCETVWDNFVGCEKGDFVVEVWVADARVRWWSQQEKSSWEKSQQRTVTSWWKSFFYETKKGVNSLVGFAGKKTQLIYFADGDLRVGGLYVIADDRWMDCRSEWKRRWETVEESCCCSCWCQKFPQDWEGGPWYGMVWYGMVWYG